MSFRLRLGSDGRLEEAVSEWRHLYQQHEVLSLNADRLRCADTDSGTYSGEDDDDMVAASDSGSNHDHKTVRTFVLDVRPVELSG